MTSPRRPVDGPPAPAVRRTPEELPLGEDALELVSEDPAPQPTLEATPDAAPTTEEARLRRAPRSAPRRRSRPTSTTPPTDRHPDAAVDAARRRRAEPTARTTTARGRAPLAQAGQEDPRPRLGAELGRDHVRRRQVD